MTSEKAPLKPVMLIILDGYGISWSKKGNAVKQAKKPILDMLEKEAPQSVLKASGSAVGLPEYQMGSSEVGHLNIGAGRIIKQELLLIDSRINDKSFFENQALAEIFSKNEYVHLIGLVSDGGVHSHINHLYALIDFAKKLGSKVYVHAILDGRDTKPQSAQKYIRRLERKLKGIGQIATIAGRFYAMDRDKRWERTKKAYDNIVNASTFYHKNAKEAIKAAYKQGKTDEFIPPMVVGNYHGVKDNEAIIFFNFRPDRVRQLTHAFVDLEFKEFKRKYVKTTFVTFTEYDRVLKHLKIAFPKHVPDKVLGEVLSQENLTQLRIAETEKYAHVTYFLNGLNEKPFKGEDRVLIQSPKVRTYDLKPEMSAHEITKELLMKMSSYDFIVLNFANPDMVGHTGVLKAATIAVETVDECLGEILKRLKGLGGCAIITADHGNCEHMIEGYNNSDTAHTSNPVPLYLFNYNAKLKRKGILADVAPTLLEILNIKKPEEMTGESLIIKD
ncbi:2,3-bisphosphoglycerate-independent phosphoglycerate mutase [Candidatus Woesearchaeota archaeon]|nr:2,3-bisphosphoglycerate-independent phosphoglycerate mutase [Candidatus Woesearchaeota archaeon]